MTMELLKAQIEELSDRLNNGIKYDEDLNLYVVTWTAKQIEDAKREAAKLYAFFNKQDVEQVKKSR